MFSFRPERSGVSADLLSSDPSPPSLSSLHPAGTGGLRGPLSAGKLLPRLPDPAGSAPPWQRAPPQLGPEEVQGSHLLLRTDDYSGYLHQSGRRCVRDSQNSQHSSCRPRGTPPRSRSAPVTSPCFCVWGEGGPARVSFFLRVLLEEKKKFFWKEAGRHRFTPLNGQF